MRETGMPHPKRQVDLPVTGTSEYDHDHNQQRNNRAGEHDQKTQKVINVNLLHKLRFWLESRLWAEL